MKKTDQILTTNITNNTNNTNTTIAADAELQIKDVVIFVFFQIICIRCRRFVPALVLDKAVITAQKSAYAADALCQPSSSTKLSSLRRFIITLLPSSGHFGISSVGICI